MNFRFEKAWFNGEPCTYFRMSDVSPQIDSLVCEVVVTVGEGASRSWGRAKVNAHIIVDQPDFLACVVGFSHKHGGGQGWFYYQQGAVGDGASVISRRTAAQLSLDQRRLAMDAWENRSPALSWVKRPYAQVDPVRQAPQPRVVAFKAVTRKDGKLISYFDRETEYVLGKTLRQKALPGHGGGYYVFGSPELARKQASRYGEEAVVLACEVWGGCVQYGDKYAYTYLRPIEVIE